MVSSRGLALTPPFFSQKTWKREFILLISTLFTIHYSYNHSLNNYPVEIQGWIVYITYLIMCMSHSAVFDSLPSHELQPARLLCPLDFSRQKYWSGQPLPSPGDLPNPEIKAGSLALHADYHLTTREAPNNMNIIFSNYYIEGDNYNVIKYLLDMEI